MPPNHYEVLGLSSAPGKRYASDDLKLAYRRALLRNHPDKASSGGSHEPATPRFTVGEITQAFKTLSDPASRLEYDRQRRLDGHHAGDAATATAQEVVDLDDLAYDGDEGVWYRGCRCGQARGYQIREADLEKEAERGELIAGCAGCSLWMRVVFQLVEDHQA
jgi:diphthamide biosynthesis protein 4